MVSLSWTTRRESGITLVEVCARTQGDAKRSRIESELDGPVWPPRRNGVPEPGWEDGAYEGTVPAEGVLPLGFASPATPTDPPVSVAWTEPTADEEGFEPCVDVGTVPSTAAGVIGALGTPVPPRNAVPVPETDATGSRDGSKTPPTDAIPDGDGRPADIESIPPAVATWLETVAERAAEAERLAAAETLPEATRSVEAVGGLDGVRSLVERMDADRRVLERVAGEVTRLQERTADLDVPVETFERLA